MVNSDSLIRSGRMVSQRSEISLGRGSSHVILVCHVSCSKILDLTVTGVTHPSGSYTCDEVCKTSLFVIRLVLVGGSCFGARDNVSVTVFQRRPKSPTVGLGSLVLSLVVTVCRR